MASGFSHKMALPAAAAASAIGRCRLLGTQMSTASMSGLATRARQSVSVWAKPQVSAKRPSFSGSRAQTACRTGRWRSSGKKWPTLL